MNRAKLLILLSTLYILTGCTISQSSLAIKETYLQKYGVEVSKNVWDASGKNGKIIQLLPDGVTVSKSYEKEMLQGATTYTFPHSNLISKTEIFDKNNKVKESIHFSNGITKQSIEFLKDNMKTISEWYDSGTPKSIEHYQEERVLSGEYFNIHNEKDATISSGYGIRPVRNEVGELIANDLIEHGALTQKTEFHFNKAPKTISQYENNQIHGKRKTFLSSGEPYTIESWNYGSQEGLTVYFSNGEKVAEAQFNNGQKHGLEVRLQNGSKVVERILWKTGQRHGPSEIFVDDYRTITWFYEGQPVSKLQFERLHQRHYR